MTRGRVDEGIVEVLRIGWRAKLYEFGQSVLRPQREAVLELTQQQIADKVGIHQTEISRIESGTTPKDYPTAQAIAECYRLDQEATNEYLHLLSGLRGLTIVDKQAFEPDQLMEFLENIDERLEEYQFATDNGLPKQISQWFDDRIIPKLWKKHSEILPYFPAAVWPVQERLARSLFQYGQTITYWKLHLEAFQNLQLVASQLDQLAEESDQLFPTMLAHSTRASACYLIGDYESSERNASLALGIAESTCSDPNFLVENCSLRAISLAKLDLLRPARHVVKNLRAMLDSEGLRPVVRRGGLETIARVESVLGSQKFWDNLEFAKTEIIRPEGGYEDSYSGLLIIRTELEAMRLFKMEEKSYAEELARKASPLYAQHERLKQEIEKEVEHLARKRAA